MMSEQAQTGRRLRLFGRLFLAAKWLWLLLLVGALIVSIFFDASWRLNGLLTVLILTPTVVPRRVRRYVYASFAAVLLGLAVWIFLPEDSAGWAPYVFKDELAALEAKLYVSDEANAAVIYNRLLADYDFESPDRGVLECLPDDASDDARFRMELRAVAGPGVDMDQTISALLEAAQRERCFFEIPYSVFSMNDQLKRLRAVKLWARLLLSAAEGARADNTERKLALHLAALQLADHIYQQSTPLDLLTALGVENLSLRATNALVMQGDLEAGQLAVVETSLASNGFHWQSDFPRIIDYEKLYTKQLAACVWEMRADGGIRAKPGALLDMDQHARGDSRTPLNKLAAVVTWFIWLRPGEASRRVDANFASCYAMAEPKYIKPVRPAVFPVVATGTVLGMLKPNTDMYSHWYRGYQQVQARRNGTRLLAALQRYRLTEGEYPETLEEIVMGTGDLLADLCGGGTFVYHRDGEGFTLHHVGENGVDDGGVTDRDAGADDVVIWPAGG